MRAQRLGWVAASVATIWTSVIAAMVLAGGDPSARLLGPLFSGAGVSAAAAAAYSVLRPKPLAPAFAVIGRALLFGAAAVVVAGRLPLMVAIMTLSLASYLAGVAYAEKRWPLALLFVPFLPTISVVRDPIGVVLWVGFLAFTVRQVGRALAGRDHMLFAGVALLDATLIAYAGKPNLAVCVAVLFVAIAALQRYAQEHVA
jgi:hypothetical protein